MNQKAVEIDAYLLGAPKSASTWIHRCFKEHAEVYVPDEDSIKYYDLNYHKGNEWFSRFYEDCVEGQIKVDPTPSYFRSQWAVPRIAAENPNAKLILSLRNPIERAFSQYWHERRRGIVGVEFEETFSNFILWSWYVETGFYSRHLENLNLHFSKDQIYISLFDDLKNDSKLFIKDIYDFIEVDSQFVPSVINKEVNKAGVQQNTAINRMRAIPKTGFVGKILRPIRQAANKSGLRSKIMETVSSKKAYDGGMSEKARGELIDIFLPDIERLEAMIDRDLSAWKV